MPRFLIRRGRPRLFVDHSVELFHPLRQPPRSRLRDRLGSRVAGHQPAATAARGERSDFASPPPAAASGGESNFFKPLTTTLSAIVSLTAAEARAAALLFPFAPLNFSSSTSAHTYLSRAVPELDVYGLINIINKAGLNLEEEIIFRRAFNSRFQSFRIADLGDYLENNTYTFEEMRYLLKIVYRKIGPHRELMVLLIKEDMLHGCTSEEELNDNPVLARVESKLEGVTKKLVDHSAEMNNLKELVRNPKPNWGLRDFTKVIAFFWRIFGG